MHSCAHAYAPVHHMCIVSYSRNIVTQYHAMQLLFYSDHMCLGVPARKEQKRKGYTSRRQFNEKPSTAPSCPGGLSHVESPQLPGHPLLYTPACNTGLNLCRQHATWASCNALSRTNQHIHALCMLLKRRGYCQVYEVRFTMTDVKDAV